MTAFTALLGGLGLFLLGMSMMTDGLKIAAGDALRAVLDSWTRSHIRAFLAGISITTLVQSSSAVTVAMIGFVNAGLLTLGQAIWIVFGANVGTTMTGWLVAFVGIKVDVVVLALPILGVGALTQLALRRHVRLAAAGRAIAGFGLFFLGVSVLQEGFANVGPVLTELETLGSGWMATFAFAGLGLLLTVLTQSSSAAIALILTASSQTDVPLALAAAAVVGTNIGTTSTALIATLGATPAAKRVAVSHVIFNAVTAAVALMALPLLLMVVAYIMGETVSVPARLAVFHTLFNCLGVALMWLATRFRTAEEIASQPRYLDSTLMEIPSLALRGLILELMRIRDMAFEMVRLKITSPSVQYRALHEATAEISSLGHALREFVEKLSKAVLPENVVQALPDIMRALQHLDDIMETTAKFPWASDSRYDQRSANWQALQSNVIASLKIPELNAENLPARLQALAAASDESYQNVKKELLHDVATGKLAIAAMEDQLVQAQSLRHVADAARKTCRRLAPWVALINDPVAA